MFFYRHKVKGKIMYCVVPFITRQNESVESEVSIVVNFLRGWVMTGGHGEDSEYRKCLVTWSRW